MTKQSKQNQRIWNDAQRMLPQIARSRDVEQHIPSEDTRERLQKLASDVASENLESLVSAKAEELLDDIDAFLRGLEDSGVPRQAVVFEMFSQKLRELERPLRAVIETREENGPTNSPLDHWV